MLVNKIGNAAATRPRLSGLHHVHVLSADLARCRDLYEGLFGLRVVEPGFDHAHGGREAAFSAAAGPVLSVSERPDLGRARIGAGLAHALLWSVTAGPPMRAIARSLVRGGFVLRGRTGDRRLRFTDADGLDHELVPSGEDPSGPVRLLGVRALCRNLVASADVLAGRLDLAAWGPRAFAAGAERVEYEPAPPGRARSGTGAVEHVAWRCSQGAQRIWRQRVIGMGARVSPVLEGEHLRSVYFREPSGVTFEIATDLPAAV